MKNNRERQPEQPDSSSIGHRILAALKRAPSEFLYFLRKGGWLVFLGFFLDLMTKLLMQAYWPEGYLKSLIHYGDSKNILGLTLTYNRGMAWGTLSGQRILLASVSIIAGIGMIVYLAYRFHTKTPTIRYALYLMIAGCFGNFIDRAFYKDGAVIDWIAVGNGDWGFLSYVCNIADVLLTAGVIVLVIGLIISLVREAAKNKEISERNSSEPKEDDESGNPEKHLDDDEKLKDILQQDPTKEKKTDGDKNNRD